MAQSVNITVAFEASVPLAVRISPEALEGLRTALDAGGWHDLETRDGTVRLNLDKVIWLRTEVDEQRVGF